jgi:hypothetical protein
MLKQSIALIGLTLSVSAHAAIIDLGSITRDTSTGLDWLDVNQTLGQSYNQISAQLGIGGAYEGYRYATVQEFDQLLVNFGYTPHTNNCPDGFANCDFYVSTGENRIPTFATMVETLGGGEGGSGQDGVGLLGLTESASAGTGGYQVGLSVLSEYLQYSFIIDDYNGEIIEEWQEWTYSARHLSMSQDISGTTLPHLGSFLVAPSAVPLPAAAWLFGSALLGLRVIKRKKAYIAFPHKLQT